MPRHTRRWILFGLGAAALAGAAYYYWTEDDEGSNQSEETNGRRQQAKNGASSSSDTTHDNEKNVRSAQSQHQVDINAHVDAHFQSIQAIARDTTVATLLRPLQQNVKCMDDMDEIIGRLQRERQSLTTAEKLDMWQSVLEQVVCRFVSVVWLVPMVHLTIRVQLNILGRTLYLQSALSEDDRMSHPLENSEPARRRSRKRGMVLSSRAQEAYLSLGEHIGSEGYLVMRDMARATAVQTAADLVGELGSVGAKTSVAHTRSALGDALATFERENLENDEWRAWEPAVMPSEQRVQELLDGAELPMAERFEVEGMWRETVGMYRSEAFRKRYMADCARLLSASMLRNVRVKHHGTGEGSGEEQTRRVAHDEGDADEEMRSVPLVSLLPIVAKEIERAMDAQSEYYAVLCEDPSLESMMARVYANGSL